MRLNSNQEKNKIKGIIYDCIHTTYIVPDRWSNSWDCNHPARCASKSYASYEGPSQPAQPVDASSAPANSDIVIWQANNGDERPQGKGGLGRWPFFSFPLSRGQVNILSPCGLKLPSWTRGMKDVCHRPDHAWVRGGFFPSLSCLRINRKSARGRKEGRERRQKSRCMISTYFRHFGGRCNVAIEPGTTFHT